MTLIHSHGQVENATTPSAGGSPNPDGEDSRRDRRGRRGVLGGRECSYIRAVFPNCLGLQKTVFPRRVGIRVLTLIHSHGQVENATAPSAGGSPNPDGEDSRRDRRGRRGVLGGRECSYIRAVFRNCLGLQKTVFPRRVGIRVLTLIHSHGQVENATAPSAGGSPNPDGEARLGTRQPFRKTSSEI
ncbi:MAG: hypothetical protein ACOX52_21555 [Verrucomicrobiota bacterium]